MLTDCVCGCLFGCLFVWPADRLGWLGLSLQYYVAAEAWALISDVRSSSLLDF